MELLIGNLKTFPLEIRGGGDRMGKSSYAMGVLSKRIFAYDGGEGVRFWPF